MYQTSKVPKSIHSFLFVVFLSTRLLKTLLAFCRMALKWYKNKIVFEIMTKNKHEELRIMPLPKKVIFSFAITEPVIIYIWCIAYRNIRLIRVYLSSNIIKIMQSWFYDSMKMIKWFYDSNIVIHSYNFRTNLRLVTISSNIQKTSLCHSMVYNDTNSILLLYDNTTI